MSERGLHVAWPFRVWLGAEIVFALVASLSIGRAPANTASNFAWPILPVVMAALLGAFYIAIAPLFVLAVTAKRWEMVRIFVLPGAIFTTALLVATIIHWDKFSVGTTPFNVWLASYVLPPPIYVGAYIWHQRRAAPPTYDNALPGWMRTVMAVAGGLLTVEAIVGFIYPKYFSDAFPWALTPLTTRVLCGFLLAISTMLLSAARENDRDRVRVVAPTLLLLLPVAAWQLSRYWDEVDTSNVRFWTTAAYLVLLFVAGVYLVRGNWRETLG